MGRNILVVDDNLDSLMIMRNMLELHGFSVRTAQSGVEALALIEQDPPEVILLDVMMPVMSGFEVLGKLKDRHETSKIPVIMVTAKIDDEDVLCGYQQGADYYITKPCTAKQLLYGISLVLGRGSEAAKERRPAKRGTA